MAMRVGGPRVQGRDYRSRFVWMALLMSSMLMVLVVRLYVLQISRGEEYKEKSIDNFVKETRIPADRGMVLDNRGRILVDNRPSYNVTLTPAFCQPSGAPKDYCLNEVLPKLATYLSLDADEVKRVEEQFRKARGLKRFRDFTVKIDVDLDALDRLEANKMELFGVDVIAVPHRNYRYGTLAAHVFGYMNEISGEELETLNKQGRDYKLGDYIGRRGVERAFEQELRGKDGVGKTVVDAKGRRLRDSEKLLEGVEGVTPAVSGHNLVLSLNLPLQQATERAFPGRAGAVVAVDVNTGFILSMLSKPAYDPNKLTGRITRAELRAISEDPLEPLIFRPVQQHYHPGSVFKPITALAALESGAFTKHSHIFCGGGYTLGRRRWRCHRDAGHGSMDLTQAMAKSCDVWFYAAADRIGIDAIAEMSRMLGLGRVAGLDLSPEVPGVVPSTAYHNRVTPGGYTRGLALNTSIGQGDSNVTPMQMVMLYAALANGGTVYKPQIVRRIEDADGRLIRAMEPVVVSKLNVWPEHLEAVREGLNAVLEPGGTAYSRRLKDIRVAGKTGTAQVVAIPAGRRIKNEDLTFFARDHAWYVAYAPVERPEIAVVVLNEHGGSGGRDAAPAAMEVIREYFRIKAEEEAARNGILPHEPEPSPGGGSNPSAPPASALMEERPA